MKKLLLIGAGGHCKSCIDVIEQIGEWQIAGIIDRKDAGMTEVLGYPIIGYDDDLVELKKYYDYALVTVGQVRSAELKVKLFHQLHHLGYQQPMLISPLAYVSKHARVGAGTIVMHAALINAGASVGANCIINSQALIEHDAVVHDHCHISTKATINGGVVVGEQSFVGSHATTKQMVVIPEQSFIKAGSVVK